MDEFNIKNIQLTSQREFPFLLRKAFSAILLYKDFIHMSEEERLPVLNEVTIEVCASSRKHLLDRPQQHDCEKPLKIMKSSQLENAEATLACTGYSCSFGSYPATSSEFQEQESCNSVSSFERLQPSTLLHLSSSDSENMPNSNVSSSKKLCVRNHNRVLLGASAAQILPSKSSSEHSSYVSDIQCEHLPDQVLYFPASVADEFEAFPSIFERHMKRYGSENSAFPKHTTHRSEIQDTPSSSNVSNRSKASIKRAKKKARMEKEEQENSSSSLVGNNLSKRWVEIDEDISVMSADGDDELKKNIELQTTESYWDYVDEDIFCMVNSNECSERAPTKGASCSSYTEESQAGANALMSHENGHGCNASDDNVASNLSPPAFLLSSRTMAVSESVQDDMAYLLYLFPASHPTFQIIKESPTELKCTFVIDEGEVLDVKVTLSDGFPETPLIWYSSSEDLRVIEILDCLVETHDGSGIVRYFRRLLKALYSVFDVEEPPQLERMREGKCPPWFTRKKPDDDIIDLTNSDDEKTVSIGKTPDNVQDTVALKRLMKEFKAVSEISLIGDCLFKWEVQLKKFYEGSRLAKDLITLKEQQGYDYVLLNIIFPKAYPFDPPFVHVVKPIINNGFVVSGGAICMELLTPGGWSSCYLVESLILQIAATLVEGEADIVFNGNLSNYSLAKARASFKMLDILHRSNGWDCSFCLFIIFSSVHSPNMKCAPLYIIFSKRELLWETMEKNFGNAFAQLTEGSMSHAKLVQQIIF
ncbi:Ubiquitin-conjugating enzyme E2 Q1 [Trichinella nelsoni]|uniref:Ubiquitin-conjugating enzyme E2 Q1 n=1 Tax=Trichinella nelsoni TaxID=6336 RepID=A0A0V0RNR6_9BILA|nr:Ubiquitin-conjugating enzyme E2 Q1 [Trichinella nelsoni]